jgi:hypothetical protein
MVGDLGLLNTREPKLKEVFSKMAKVVQPKLNKAKVVKLIRDSDPDRKFNPTLSDVVFWYDNLNELMFESALPTLTGVHFKRIKGYWAEMECSKYSGEELVRPKLVLSYSYNSFKEFLEIIAHEMIHVWEYVNFGIMGHGERFFSWEPKFKDQLGMIISEKK